LTTQTEYLDDVGLGRNDRPQGETWGWRILRPPPVPAVVFGAVYGLIAGAVIVYDVVVLIRMAKVLIPKIRERTPIIGPRD
jgi:hypothetical protein